MFKRLTSILVLTYYVLVSQCRTQMCSCSKMGISCTEACKCHDAGLCQNPSNDVGEIEEESQDVEILEGENENEEN